MSTPKLDITPQDILSGTWMRVRAGLVRELWRLRIELEKDLTPEETSACRTRIKVVKELLHADPRKDDYALESRSLPPHKPDFLEQALRGVPVLEETLGDFPSPGPGRS